MTAKIDPFSLEGYLERIGLSLVLIEQEVPGSFDLLKKIVWAHATHIPFENLSIIYPHTMRVVDSTGSPPPDAAQNRREKILVSLEPVDIYQKLVLNRRGGFCFEQNLLQGRALRELGFGVTQIGAKGINRAADLTEEGYPLSCTTHLTLIGSTKDGCRYLIDNGFGWSGMPRSPLPLLNGVEMHEEATGEVYRMISGDLITSARQSYDLWGCHRFRAGSFGSEAKESVVSGRTGWFLQYKNKPESGWWDIFHFYEENTISFIDCELGAWYASTNPNHPQSQIKLVALMTNEGRYSIIDNRLTIRKSGETTEKILQSQEEIALVLKEYFKIILPTDPTIISD